MARRTLYVSDEDEQVWTQAQKHGSGTEHSLSKLATLALAQYLAGKRADTDDEDDRDVTVSIKRAENVSLMNQFRLQIRKFGREKVAVAFARACYKEGVTNAKARGAFIRIPKAK